MAGGVLLAHDRTTHSQPVAIEAKKLADGMGLPLTVVHVVSEKDIEARSNEVPEESGYLDVILDQVRARVRADLATWWGERSVHRVDIQVLIGEADELVLKTLRSTAADYAVIGVRSRSRVGKLLFGSSAQSILLLSPCPVLAVPVSG